MSRGGLDWEGIGYRGVTYEADASLKAGVLASGVAYAEGKAVTITGNGTVGFGNAGNPLLGKLDKYESDGYVTVQDAGYAVLPGVPGSLPTAGDFLVVNGAGAVQASVGAVGPTRAVSVNSTDNTVVVFIA